MHLIDTFVIVESDVAHSGSYNRSFAFPSVSARLPPSLRGRIHYRQIRVREVPQMRLCAAGRERASVAGAMRCEHYMRGSLLGEVFAAGAKPTDILVSGDVDEIRSALAAGAPVDGRDANSTTALMEVRVFAEGVAV